MAIAVGQFTIYDFHDVYSATTPPTNPQKNQVWLDTSATPPVMKTWNGTEWLVANDYVSGGTNLILNSRQVILNRSDNGNYDCSVAEKDYVKIIPKNNGNVYGYVSTSKARTKGVQYTISFEVMTPTKIGFYWYPSENYSKSNYIDSDSKWQKIQFTYTQTGKDNESTSLFGLQGLTAGSTYLLKNLQLETGNRASDWSQAPEDIEKELIRVESKVEVNADAILQKVSKTNYTGNTIVSMINQTAESVKISAKNIELNGAVTFSSFDSSTQSKITNIENTANNASSAANTAQQTANSAVDKIDNLEIGSRNYILNSNFATGNTSKWSINFANVSIVDDSLLRVKAAKITTTAGGQGLYQIITNNLVLFENDYSASVLVKGTAGQVVRLSFEKALVQNITLSGDWDVVEVTMPRDKYNTWNKVITLYSNSAQTFYATKFLLTTGNKILDWMPAPEDTELEVTNAKNIANNAAQTATTAKSTADSASSTANTASSNASTALSTANTAKSTATSAQSTANTANANATNAVNTANNASSVASTANQNASTAVNTANSANSKIDNLEIGGRNLARLSDMFSKGNGATGITSVVNSDNTLSITAAAGNGNWFTGFVKDTNGIEDAFNDGDNFTISFLMSSSDTTKIPTVYIKQGMGYYSMKGALGSNKSMVYYTGTWKKTNGIALHLGFGGVVGTIKIHNWKIEKGSKPTAWTRALEDVSADINTAQNAANNAQQTANAANTNASTALSTANTAKTTATNAQSTASTANTNATTAINTANNANSTASTANNTANTAKSTADSAKIKAEEADSKIENLEVGGVNIAPNTKTFVGWKMDATQSVDSINGFTVYHYKYTDTSAYKDLQKYGLFEPTPNTEYTLSFWAKGNGKIKSFFYPNCVISGVNSQGVKTSSSDGNIQTTLSDTWTRYWITWKTLSSVAGIKSLLPCRQETESSEVFLYGVKFEKGNKATDWSPAPEDVDLEINNAHNAASNAQQTANTANSNANSAISTANTAKSTADSASSTANTAKTTADSAKSTATTAQSTASQAQSAANTANTNATTAVNTANNASSAASTAQSTANTAKSTADSAKTEAANANSKVDNMEIGGRNLLKGTYGTFKTVTFGGWDYYFPNNLVTWEKNKKLIGRIYIKPTEQDASCMLHVRYTDSTYSQYRGNVISAGSEGYSKVEITVPNRDDISHIQFSIRHLSGSTPSDTVSYKEAKVEHGTKFTAWTPAPEDVESDINNAHNAATNAQNAASAAQSTANTANSTANTAKSTADSAKTTATNASTAASQAQSTANTANSNASNALTKADNATTAANNAVNTANNANSTAASANSKIDNLEFGGRNLLKNTALKNTTGWSLASGITLDKVVKCGNNNTLKYNVTGLTADTWRAGSPDMITINPSKKYSASCEYYIPTDHGINSGASLEIQWFNDAGTRVGTRTKALNTGGLDVWQVVKLENVTPSSGAVKANARVWVRQNGKFWVGNIKLEEGTKASAWSASQEDIDLEINNAQNAANNAQNAANSANTAAGNAQNTANNAQSSANTANNKLDSWSYPTDKTTINGGKIMTGSVTAQQIASNTITADKIKAGAITANMITSGTFKGVNFEAGGSGNSGSITVKNSSNTLSFMSNSGGTYATKIGFLENMSLSRGSERTAEFELSYGGLRGIQEYGGTIVPYEELNITRDRIYMKKDSQDVSVENGSFPNVWGETGIFAGGALFKNIRNSQQTTILPNLVSTSGELQAGTHIRANGEIIAQKTITSVTALYTGGQVQGSTFIQHGANYGIPLEIGQYIDMHNIGSTNDVDVRLVAHNRQGISIAGGADLSKTVIVGVGSSDKFIHNNTANSYLQMKDNGELHFNSRPVMTLVNKNGHMGMATSNGVDNFWIRTTTTGLIPYKSGGGGGSIGTDGWWFDNMWSSSFRAKNNVQIVDAIGTCFIGIAGNGDGINYGSNNMRTRCHWGWGISDNYDNTNAVIDARAGRFIGKSAYWHNSSKSLKSDVRVVTSETIPMALNLREYDTIDNHVTMEMIEDFLDTISIKTYVSDYNQKGVTQEEHDDSKAQITQLGYIADEFADHPLFPYIGEMIGDYHAINTTALISSVIAGYQSEKRRRLALEENVKELESRLSLIEEKLRGM